jgi:hypothetical protein
MLLEVAVLDLERANMTFTELVIVIAVSYWIGKRFFKKESK